MTAAGVGYLSLGCSNSPVAQGIEGMHGGLMGRWNALGNIQHHVQLAAACRTPALHFVFASSWGIGISLASFGVHHACAVPLDFVRAPYSTLRWT